MTGRFISFLLAFAVLFGSAIAPAVAHAESGIVVHNSEVLDIHVVASMTDEDRQESDSTVPAATDSHHHCTIGLTATAPDVSVVEAIAPGSFRRIAAAQLASHAQAPPTQPPSA